MVPLFSDLRWHRMGAHLSARGTATPCAPERCPPDRYLTRTGDQLTYVFYKDGIEDVALRPAFEGKVSEFGMLILFPAPPAIRKISDDIFYNIKNAVEPPTAEIDLYVPAPGAASLAGLVVHRARFRPQHLARSRVSTVLARGRRPGRRRGPHGHPGAADAAGSLEPSHRRELSLASTTPRATLWSPRILSTPSTLFIP